MPAITHHLTACQVAAITDRCDASVATAAAVRGIHCTICCVLVAAAASIIHGGTLHFVPVATNGCVCWHMWKHRNRDCPPWKGLHRVVSLIGTDWGLGQPPWPQPGKVPLYTTAATLTMQKLWIKASSHSEESNAEVLNQPAQVITT